MRRGKQELNRKLWLDALSYVLTWQFNNVLSFRLQNNFITSSSSTKEFQHRRHNSLERRWQFQEFAAGGILPKRNWTLSYFHVESLSHKIDLRKALEVMWAEWIFFMSIYPSTLRLRAARDAVKFSGFAREVKGIPRMSQRAHLHDDVTWHRRNSADSELIPVAMKKIYGATQPSWDSMSLPTTTTPTKALKHEKCI